jgi:hypothetical protein
MLPDPYASVPSRLAPSHLSLFPVKKVEIAKRTQFHSKPMVLQILERLKKCSNNEKISLLAKSKSYDTKRLARDVRM